MNFTVERFTLGLVDRHRPRREDGKLLEGTDDPAFNADVFFFVFSKGVLDIVPDRFMDGDGTVVIHFQPNFLTGPVIVRDGSDFPVDVLILAAVRVMLVAAVAVNQHAAATNAKGPSLASRGNMIVNETLAKVDSMEIIPAELSSFIYPVIKYRTTLPGLPEDDPRIADVITYLDDRKKE